MYKVKVTFVKQVIDTFCFNPQPVLSFVDVMWNSFVFELFFFNNKYGKPQEKFTDH